MTKGDINKRKKEDKKGEKKVGAIKIKNNTEFISMDLQDKLNKITANATLLRGKDNMIELDPENPQHREWYEDDELKGE